MNDLAIVINNYNRVLSQKGTVDVVKSVGFDSVFLQWYHKKDLLMNDIELLKYVRKNNLNIIFAHLSYENIDLLWTNSDESKIEIEKYKNDLKALKENDVELVIMHAIRKINFDKNNKCFLNNIREIINYAEELKIKIAFENTKVEGVLEYIFDNITSDYIGVCYDFGHDHAFFNDNFNFERFKNLILAVHIHDNFGSSDEHLLPFDGTIDYEKVFSKLKMCNYNGPITLELCYMDDYVKEYAPIDFFKEAYNRAIKLKKLIDK